MDEIIVENTANPAVHVALTGFKVLFVATATFIGYKLASDNFDATIGKTVMAKFDVPSIES